MRTKLIAFVVAISIPLGIGWYVVAQETFPFAPLPLFSPNTVLTSNQLNEIVKRINAIIEFINNDLTDAPKEIVVHCPTDSLAAALNNANKGDTIKINGTCSELVTVSTDGVTLDGQGIAVIDGGGGFTQNVLQGVITIDGARHVTIKNLTVENGPDGVLARRGAAVIFDHVTAQDNADDGLQVEETSTAEIINCTALRNGSDGMLVSRSSSATFSGTTLSDDNGGQGLAVANSSHAFFTPNATMQANSNTQNGIAVSGGSSASFQANVTVHATNNGDDGIIAAVNFDSSHLELRGPATITNNDLNGLLVVNSSDADLRGNVQIHTNTANGILVSRNSNVAGNLVTGSSLSIINNGASGVLADDSSVWINNATITGNETDINAFFGARLTLNGNTIGSKACEPTVLFRGIPSCP